MAHRQFLVTYPDGSREHIDREERDSLLYSRDLKQTGPKQYEYIGQPRTFHLSATQNTVQCLAKAMPSVIRRHLDISVVFELGDKRRREIEETVEGMELRLSASTN